jgi:zinc transporter
MSCVVSCALVDRLGERVDDAEDLILAGRFEDQGTVLGRVRRFVARLRRHLNAKRSALATLPVRLPACFDSEHKHSLHRAIEHLDAVAQDLELVQERTRLLQEEREGGFWWVLLVMVGIFVMVLFVLRRRRLL